MKETKTKRAIGLLLLAVLLAWGCAETTTSRSGTINRAATCAMCGASVSGDYFYRTADRSTGPGQGGW